MTKQAQNETAVARLRLEVDQAHIDKLDAKLGAACIEEERQLERWRTKFMRARQAFQDYEKARARSRRCQQQLDKAIESMRRDADGGDSSP